MPKKSIQFELTHIKYIDERGSMADMVLKLAESFRDDWFPGCSVWESLQFAMIMLSLYQIHLTGRSASASDLSRKTGMPNATVRRKLASLKKTGYVHQYGLHYELSVDGLNQPRLLEGFRRRLGTVKVSLQRMLMLLTVPRSVA